MRRSASVHRFRSASYDIINLLYWIFIVSKAASYVSERQGEEEDFSIYFCSHRCFNLLPTFLLVTFISKINEVNPQVKSTGYDHKFMKNQLGGEIRFSLPLMLAP